jgi:hypothetical protein
MRSSNIWMGTLPRPPARNRLSRLLDGSPNGGAPPAERDLSPTTQKKPNDDAKPHCRHKSGKRLTRRKVPHLVDRLPISVLRAAGRTVHLAARLRCRVAHHCAHGVLDFAADISGRAFDAIFVNHLISTNRMRDVPR